MTFWRTKRMKVLGMFAIVVMLLFFGTKEEASAEEGILTESITNSGAFWNEEMYLLGVQTPEKPYKIANVVSGVHVYWTAVDGVEKYGVWRSETGRNGDYIWLGNPSDTHFTDIKVESGKTYFYKISAVIPGTNKHTEKSDAIGIVYVSTPDITERYNRDDGILLLWDKIDGATGYAVYRKSYEGTDAWTRVGTIEGNTTFEWTDISVAEKNGTVYRYTIRALAGSDLKTLSGCRNTGRTMVRLTSRAIETTEVGTTSVKCSWATTSQATGYEIRFTDESGKESVFTVGGYKTGVKTFTGLTEGTKYSVEIRTYRKLDGVGTFYSAWSEAVQVTTVVSVLPEIEVPQKPYKITNVVNGIHVYWTAVEGVERYGVWRSETGKDGTYTWLGNPDTVHFTDTKTESGKTYFYKITAMDPESGIHSEKSDAIGIAYVATPDITGRENTKKGIALKWDKVTGATGYGIYRKSYAGADAWVRIATVEGNETFIWTDTSVAEKNGTVYRYTIRALAGSDLKTLSGCRNMGRTMARLSETVLNSAVTSGPDSVKCGWTTVSHVSGYEIRFVDENGKIVSRTVENNTGAVLDVQELALRTQYNVQVRSFLRVDGVGTFYSAWSEAKSVKTWLSKPQNYEKYKEIWHMIYTDESRWGMWDLTYREFLEIYDSIGTENDLFIKMLKEKGPRHTDPTIFYEFDGMQNLQISFPDVETEKIYALHYAPFEYNSEDLESGNTWKSEYEAFLDHGGVCGILSNTYLIFIREILDETDWKYCKYGNAQVNHEVLLVKTEDGKVFQVDNCGVDYWWLGLEFRPDYDKIGVAEPDAEVMQMFERWREDFEADRAYWHTFCILHNYSFETNKWNCRPIWFDFDTNEFSSYWGREIPKYYTVTYRGLPGKVISMAGYANLDGYVKLDELVFK